MGLRDVLFGKKNLKAPAPDRLFAMSTAAVTLQESLRLTPTGKAGVVFQALPTADFDEIVREMQEVLAGQSDELESKLETASDEFGYRWVVLKDPDLDDLVVGLNGVSSSIQGGGYGDRLLAAVFPFTDDAGQPVQFIYNFKRGAFYPFVPAGGSQQRDSEREMRIKAQIGAELPIEAELERWFPLWGAPV